MGVDLPGDQSAFDHAVDILRRLLRTPSGQRLSPAYSMEVTDDHGRFLFSVPLDLPIVQRRMVAEHLVAPLHRRHTSSGWFTARRQTSTGIPPPAPLPHPCATRPCTSSTAGGHSREDRGHGMQPDTHYATSGEVQIAYQVIGTGPLDLVLVPGYISNLDHAWEEPSLVHFISRLCLSAASSCSTSAAPAFPTGSAICRRWKSVWTTCALLWTQWEVKGRRSSASPKAAR